MAGPEQPRWHRVDGHGWVYGTSRDIQRALTEDPTIDDSAAREWMQGGTRLDVPPPTFARDDFRWRLRRADGILLELDPVTSQWVPVDDAESP